MAANSDAPMPEVDVNLLLFGIRREVAAALSKARPDAPPTDAEIDAHTYASICISLAKALNFIVDRHGLAVAIEVTNPGLPDR